MSDPVRLRALIETTAQRIVAHADELTELDRRIGDGDHGLNMRRGCEEVLARLDEIAARPPAAALEAVGKALVMKVGGASGPLYGTLFLRLSKSLPDDPLDAAAMAAALDAAIGAVKSRGKSEVGAKTLLDVLVPVQQALAEGADTARLRAVADAAAEATVDMVATRGRASFLGERSRGHMDPGARSSALMVHAVCDVLEEIT